MKQTDLKALEKTLASFPTNIKKYLADRMIGQISSQAITLLDTAKPHLPCPHCGAEHLAKWGRSGGLQRYRCRNPDCHKTFNALTGTPLAKLQHRDKWFDYLRCMRDSLTLRVSAARVGIDLKTAFRWRDRFLKTSAQDNANPLSGIIEVDETFFLESCKGKRHITHRKPRKRGGQGNMKKKNRRFRCLLREIGTARSVTWWIQRSRKSRFMSSWHRSSIVTRSYALTDTAGIKPSPATTELPIID